MENLSIVSKSELLQEVVDKNVTATVVTDPKSPDDPIIYVNQMFLEMTGYEREEIIGRNCRFLQGPDTDRENLDLLKSAVVEKREITVTLKNYRKNGEGFWNKIHIKQVKAGQDYYNVGYLVDVSHDISQQVLLEEKEQELNGQLLPILPIEEGVGAVALVGKMTNERFNALISKVSFYIERQNSEYILLDVTGLLWEDYFMYSDLLTIQEVTKLMGCELYLTGITPRLAKDIVDFDERATSLRTFSSIEQALVYIRRMKIR